MPKRKTNKSRKLSNAELESERAQLLALSHQPNVDKKLIDLALKSSDDRVSTDEINEYLGRHRNDNESV